LLGARCREDNNDEMHLVEMRPNGGERSSEVAI